MNCVLLSLSMLVYLLLSNFKHTHYCDDIQMYINILTAFCRVTVFGHELIKSIHPHPTMSEAIMEAAAAYDEVIHI